MPSYPEIDVSELGIQDVYAFLQTRRIVDVLDRGTFCP